MAPSRAEIPDVESAYTKFLTDMEAPESKNLIFWVDNCSAQNKNWLLFTSCIHMVNAPGGHLQLLSSI